MEEIDIIVKKAEHERDLLKHPYVGTEHLLLALLSYDDNLTNILKEYKLTYNKFKRKLKEIIGLGSNKSPYVLYTPMLRNVLSIANEEDNSDDLHITLFNSILKAKEGIAIRILESLNIKIDIINNCSSKCLDYQDNIITNRECEIEQIFQILMRKNKCNPLLIGDSGVGKTAIVEEIQRRLIRNKVPKTLIDYKIINVDISSLVAGTKYRGDFENKIKELLKSVENKKVILFIDEIHTLIYAGGAEGAISAGNILKPYLARGKIKCIGATTINEYHEYFELDEALNRRFEKIIIKEPSLSMTINILKNNKENYEKFHNIKIDNKLIEEIVHMGNKYITNKRNPDKSIELLDSCCTNAKYNENTIVDINNLYQVFNYKYGIDLNNKEIKNILDNKTILITNNDVISKITNNKCNIITINGDNINTVDDMYDILGNPYYKNNYYLLKSAIDYAIGILILTNYNHNKILIDFIKNITKTRKIKNNFGKTIDLTNYIIIMEKLENNGIGFINDINSNKHNYLELNEKILLSNA